MISSSSVAVVFCCIIGFVLSSSIITLRSATARLCWISRAVLVEFLHLLETAVNSCWPLLLSMAAFLVCIRLPALEMLSMISADGSLPVAVLTVCGSVNVLACFLIQLVF